MKASQILLNFTDLNSARPLSGVYVLCGARARRITAVAQQHRAISLVEALLKEGSLRRGTTIGIIGGGIAGCTAAYWAVCNGAAVTLYEKGPQLLDVYSKASHRYLHPGLFNWPHPGWDIQHTNLPCLNWSFNTAQNVGNLLRGKMKELEDEAEAQVTASRQSPGQAMGPMLTIRRDHACGLRQKAPQTKPSIVMPNGTDESFDIIVIAVGEGGYDGAGPGYWDGPEDGAFMAHLRGEAHREVTIVGNGDGGIMDFLRLKTPIQNEQDIVQFMEDWRKQCPRSLENVEKLVQGKEGEAREAATPINDLRIAMGNGGLDLFRTAVSKRQRWQEQLKIDWESHAEFMAPGASPLLRTLLAGFWAADSQRCEFHSPEATGKAKKTRDRAVLERFIKNKPMDQLDCGASGNLVRGTGPVSKLAGNLAGMQAGDWFDRYYLFPDGCDEAIAVHPKGRHGRKVLETYREAMRKDFKKVSIPILASSARRADEEKIDRTIDLLAVYTKTHVVRRSTSDAEDRQAAPEEFLDAVAAKSDVPQRWVLMGEGGRGKTTLVEFLAASMVANNEDGRNINAYVKKECEVVRKRWASHEPVLIRLREIDDWPFDKIASARSLVDRHCFGLCHDWSLTSRMKESWCVNRLVLESFRDDMESAMEGRGVLLVLDGMDEVIGERREEIATLLNQSFGDGKQDIRADVFVTARTATVRNGSPDWHSTIPWPTLEIQPLSDDPSASGTSQQERFVTQYHVAMGEDDPRGAAVSLMSALRSRDLSDIAKEPILLAALARLHADIRRTDSKAELPESKVEVLWACIHLLLREWDDTREVPVLNAITKLNMGLDLPWRVLETMASNCILEGSGGSDNRRVLKFRCADGPESLQAELKKLLKKAPFRDPEANSMYLRRDLSERVAFLRKTGKDDDWIEFALPLYASCLAGMRWATSPNEFFGVLDKLATAGKNVLWDHVRPAVALGLAGLKLGLDKPAGQRQPSMARVWPLLVALERKAREATDENVQGELYFTLGDALKELRIEAHALGQAELDEMKAVGKRLREMFALAAKPGRTRAMVGRALGWVGDRNLTVLPYLRLGDAGKRL